MKKFLQKRLSFVLALLMVFSMFVFNPEMFTTKVEAANTDTFGKHLVRVILYVGGDEWECDSGKNLYLLYKESRDSTTIKSALLSTTSKNNFDTKNTWYWLGGADPTYGWTAGHDEERPGIEITGFPVGIDFSAMKSNNSCEAANYNQGHIQVWDYNANAWVNVEDSEFSDGGGSGYTFTRKENLVTLTGAKAPKATTIAWANNNPGSGEVTIKPNTTISVTGTNAVSVTDQYGASLTTSDINFRIYDSETGTTQVSINYATAGKTSENKPEVTVKTAANEWVLGNGATEAKPRSMYVQAYCNQTGPAASVDTGTDRYEVAVSNYQVKVNYDLNGGTYWGTEDDHTATKSETVDYGFCPTDIPTAAYKKGYTFDGIFTAASGGTEVTATTNVKASGTDPASITYYAHWSPIDCPVEFYNSDGQLIKRTVAKYDDQISSVASPATPSYPGKQQAVNGTYQFAGWIVWEAPGHDDWVGSPRSDHNGQNDKLDYESGVLKFIATYTLQGGSAKTYNATFKFANGNNITPITTGAYWTQITLYDTTSKPTLAQGVVGSAVAPANGFDTASYDYTFEGWTTTVPANGKWTEVEEGEADYAPGSSFRLKANVTFYPCYSKVTKQCQVTKKYYVFSSGNNIVLCTPPETVKGIETTLGNTFDLGAPELLSFNQNGYTYTFKGWKQTTTTIVYGTEGVTYDIPYAGGKAEIVLTGDVTYMAIYEKTAVKYNAYYYNGKTLVASYEDLPRYNEGALVSYNTAIQFDGDTPERERDSQTGFTFVGWVADQTKVLNPTPSDLVTDYHFEDQSKTFYAAYATFDYYTVTFKNDTSEIIQTSSDYVANDTIAYTATKPAEGEDAKLFIPVVSNKASGVQFQYTFMGWQSNVEEENNLSFTDEVAGIVKYAIAVGEGNNITVTGNRVYTAVFKKEIREYTIYLYGIGSDPDYTVNEDGYTLYTYEETEYFVKDKKIYMHANEEYVLYAGELTIGDLTPVKPEAKKTLTLKYGENIYNAVKALYTYDGNGTADRNVIKIDGKKLQIVPYGETEKVDLPYATDQYSYAFNGWTPTINPNATVTGDVSFVATYRTDNVLYNVHWFVPQSFDASSYVHTLDAEPLVTVNYYRYKRAIAVPAKTPVTTAPATVPNYTWSFLGWYECDENLVIKRDAQNNEIKYAKNTLAEPREGSRDYYYVAKFGFVPDNYTVKVYNEAGTELLGTYKGAYGSPIYITNYSKLPDADYHFTLTSFVDIDDPSKITDASSNDKTEYTVLGDANLKVVYEGAEHDWAHAFVQHTTPATYAADGTDTLTCAACSRKTTRTVPKLIDVNGPTGKVAIKSYNWTADALIPGVNDEAYIRSDSLVAIMAVDYGANDINDEPIYNAGEGIKSITYTWSNGTPGGTVTYGQYENTSANVDIQLPTGSDFTEGMTLTVTVTDWKNNTYVITTGALYTDTEKPVIDSEESCEGFKFAVKEDHLESVVLTLDGAEVALSGHAVALGATSEYAAAYNFPAENEVLEPGTYILTATDKAGNSATKLFNVTGAHDWNKGKETQKLTCTTAGIKTYTCTVCGATKTDETTALGHKWNAKYEGEGDTAVFVEYIYTVDVAATCLVAGSKSVHCSRCDAIMEDSDADIAALGHDYKYDKKDATCASAGYKITTCKRCDLYEYEGYEQLVHAAKLDAQGAGAEGWIIGKAATCTAAGNKYQICDKCGEKINKTAIPMIAHDYKDITDPNKTYCKASVVPGATEDTYHLRECKNCGYQYEFNLAAKTHHYQNVPTDATCTNDKVNHYTCSVCNDHYDETERLTSLGHEWATEYTIDAAATCLAPGQKSIHCKREGCQEKKDVTVIPALGHDYVGVVTTPATGHDAGLMTYTCTRCEEGTEGHSYTEVIPPTGEHNYIVTDSKAATCTAEGYKTYVCSDANCDVTYTDIIPMKDHEQGTEIVSKSDATCVAVAVTVYKCANCASGTVTVYGTALADHKKGNLVKLVTAATCTTDGSGIYNCSVCGETVSAPIDATGAHKYNDTVVTPVTCLTGGTVKHTCKVCGHSYDETIEAVGEHTWNTEYTVDEEAKCEALGSKSIHCSACDTVKEGTSVDIPKLGHDQITDAAVPATCSKTGLTAGWHCSRCDVKLAQTVVPKLAHTEGDLLVVNKVPTCVAKGESVYRCEVCGESFVTETAIDANAHNWGAWSAWTTVTAATCTEPGSEKRTRTCKNTGCTAEAQTETRPIAELGHDMIVDPDNDPITFVEDGETKVKTFYKCQREGCTYTEEKSVVATVRRITIGATVIELINGEKLTEAKIAEALGAYPSKPTEPGLDGAYVVKWKNGTEEVKLPCSPATDMTLTYEFVFVANKYTVTFYNFNGKVISSAEYVKDDEVVVPEDLFVSGYKFCGWTDGIGEYAADEIPAVGTSSVDYMPWLVSTENVKIYYVTFKNDSGTKVLYTSMVECVDNIPVTFELPTIDTPTKTSNSVYHYEFAAWVDNYDIVASFPMQVNSNITVKAKFNSVRHDADATAVVSGATCTKDEMTTYTCNDCGFVWEQHTAPAKGHHFVEIDRQPGEGDVTIVYYECTRCHDTYNKTVKNEPKVIAVRVTDGGNIIVGATVNIFVGNKQITAETQNDGCAYFNQSNVPDGTYRYTVIMDGYDTASGEVTVSGGEALITVKLKAQEKCRCVCHASSFFGKLKRNLFNKFFKLFNPNYKCCSCGHCEEIYK